MEQWFLQDGSSVQEISEDKLRRRLAKGDLSGLELAHPQSETGWRPLHDWPVFAETVPFQGSARGAAQARARHGFFWHLGAFLGVIGYLTLQQGSVPSWSVFWMLGLAGHALRALPAIRSFWEASEESQTEAVPVSQPSAGELQPADGFLGETEQALTELAQVGGDRVDIAALGEGAQALQDALERMAEGADPEAGRRLQEALDQATGQVEREQDAATAEIYQSEVQAIRARLDAWTDASAAASRILARQRTLVHQIHALRLDLAREESPPPAQADPIQNQVQRLRKEAVAAAEVERDLARARQARKLS